MYDCYDQNSLLMYFVYKAIAIDKPLTDILISDFRHHPADEWKFFYCSRCLKNLRDHRLRIVRRIPFDIFRDRFKIFDRLR